MLNKNWKHVLPLALTTLVCMTSVARAETTTNSDSAHMRNLDNRVSALEQRKGAGGMINPQGRPQVRDGVDLFIYGNLLYWNAHENGLTESVKLINPDALIDGTANAEIHDVVNNLTGKWNWGFRAGIGYNTMHDGWDLRLTWLRFSDTGHSRPSADDATQFTPTQNITDLSRQGSTVTAVRGYWGLNLNQLDLDLGREFFVSKWLTLRPHMGLRSDWIHQNLNIDYYGYGAQLPALPDVVYQGKDRWWGIGLEGGLDTQWGLGGGWSIFGNMAGAILYGLHEIQVTNFQEKIPDTSSSVKTLNFSNVYRISHPVLDFQMGLRWDTMFYNDRFHLGFDLGWEHHVYFSQNEFPVSDSLPLINGDLTTQGWTFAARFDF